MAKNFINSLLEDFLDKFTADVLVPISLNDAPLLKIPPQELPRDHAYWRKRAKLVRTIKNRISATLIKRPISPGYPDYEKALLGGYLNDLVNLFVRELLGEIGTLHPNWDDDDLGIFRIGCPYEHMRDEYIYYETATAIDQLLARRAESC